MYLSPKVLIKGTGEQPTGGRQGMVILRQVGKVSEGSNKIPGAFKSIRELWVFATQLQESPGNPTDPQGPS